MAENKKIKLSNNQILALGSIFQHAMMNAEFAASFIVNPHPVLESYSMNKEDIAEIVAYFKHVEKLAKRDHREDW